MPPHSGQRSTGRVRVICGCTAGVSGVSGWDGRGREEEVETYTEPVDDVAVGWVAGTARELFFASGVDDYGFFEGSFVTGSGQH